MMKRPFPIIISLFVSYLVYGQNSIIAQYNQFKRQAHQEYSDFRKKVNQDYADWMRKAWEWHDKIEPMPRPKEEMQPPVIYSKENEKEKTKPIPYEDITPMPSPQPPTSTLYGQKHLLR